MELDPSNLKPLTRFTHKDIDSRFKVRKLSFTIALLRRLRSYAL